MLNLIGNPVTMLDEMRVLKERIRGEIDDHVRKRKRPMKMGSALSNVIRTAGEGRFYATTQPPQHPLPCDFSS